MPDCVLVAGGAGYIGSHTSKLLLRSGRIPVVLDNLVTGNRFSLRYGPFFEGGIQDAELVKRIAGEHSVSSAVLFAGYAYIGESTGAPRKYYGNNVINNLRFLDALAEAGVSRIVFSSSCSVYGVQPVGLLTEDSPTNPLSPYAESKQFIERALCWYGRAYGLSTVCLRYFNAAGADPEGELGECHNPETHLIPLAILAALGGPPLRVFGGDYPTPDGTCIRDYVHVTDLAEGHIRALEYLAGGGESSIINLGAGVGSSIREVIRVLETVSGRTVPVEAGPRRAGDAPILVADHARARRVLGWVPRYSDLETVVRTAWNWYSRSAGKRSSSPGG